MDTVRWGRVASAVPIMLMVTLGWAAPARSEGFDLPSPDVYEMNGVPGGDRLFIATGGDSVLVADRSGRELAEVGGLHRNVGLGMGEDGTAWVALPDSREIAAIDPDTLTVRARYPVPYEACPGDVAVTGRFVVFGWACWWFSQDENPPSGGGVGVLDTETGAVSLLEPFQPSLRPIVATSPGLPGRFFAVDYNSHSTSLAQFDVTDGTPRWLNYHYLQSESVFDMAVSPDGATVAVATYAHGLQTYHTADTSPATMYPLGCAGFSVGWSAQSSHVAVGCGNAAHDRNVVLFQRGNATPVRIARLTGLPERGPWVRALVVGPDANDVMLASQVWFDYRSMLDQVGLRPSGVAISGPQTAFNTLPLTVRATVLLGDTPAPAGTPVVGYRELAGPPTPLGTAYTDDTGTATFTDTPPVNGQYTYLLRFEGDRAYGPAEARHTVQVNRLPTSLSVGFEAGRPKRGTLPGQVVVTLGPTVGHRGVTLTATTSAGTQLVTMESVPFDGPLRVPYTVTTPTTFTAQYDGNQWQEPATASTTVLPPERNKP